MPGTRRYSLAHLTMMEVSPPRLVLTAAAAGYHHVGLRLIPTSDGCDHGMLTDPAVLRDTQRALDDTGLGVLDVEVARLRPDGFGDMRPFLDAAAELGAQHVVCTVEDDDVARREDAFAAFTAEALERAVRPVLEYMVFSRVRSSRDAWALVERAAPEAGVLVDTLHHVRGGQEASALASLPAQALPYFQLCDGRYPGRAETVPEARDEAVYDRLLPGTGSLPLVELVAALPMDAVVSVEVPRRGHRRPSHPAADALEALTHAREVVAAATSTVAALAAEG